MGLRFRTPIGSLREQRRRAEGQPLAQLGRAVTVRYRNTETVGFSNTNAASTATDLENNRRENLIERLRSVLANDRSETESSPSEYQVIQDELARISHLQAAHQQTDAKDRAGIDAPRNLFFDSATPFRYIVINSESKNFEFNAPIPKLAIAPTNLDAYVSQIRPFEDNTPRPMPLTLLLSSEYETPPVRVKADPSDHAAALTQSNVTYSPTQAARSVLPKSLVLSLLDDK